MPVWYFTSGVHKGWWNSCFFGWFTETVQCEGFAYGDWKNKAIQEVHRALIQHGESMNYNFRNTRCHHYKQIWLVEVGAQHFLVRKKVSMYFNISTLHNICLYSCCYIKTFRHLFILGFFSLMKLLSFLQIWIQTL